MSAYPYGYAEMHREADGRIRCSECQEWCDEDPRSGYGLCRCCEAGRPSPST